jgi:hypothetical protein
VISTTGLDGARNIIGRLRTNSLLPPCPRSDTGTSAAETGKLQTSATAAPPAPGQLPGEPSATSPPSAVDQPGGGPLPDQSAAGQPPSTITVPPLPERTSEPGVDCRTVR